MSKLALFAVTPLGPVALPAPPGVVDVNEAFDHLPLGIYEGLRTFGHTRFIGLAEHLDRAERSIRGAGWDFKLDRAALCRCLHHVVLAYPEPEMRVRFDVLARPVAADGTESRTLVALSPHHEIPAALLARGVSVRTVRALRRPRPLIKTADFVVERRVFPTQTDDSFENVLMGSDGELLEGASSNLCFVKAGELRTAGTSVLEGVTRGFVLALAHSLGIGVKEAPVLRDDVPSLSEGFLTSSTRGVVPVVTLDGAAIGDGRPGPITEKLRRAYDDFVASNACEAFP